MIPMVEDNPVVPTNDEHELTLGIASLESLQCICHITGTRQTKLDIRDLHSVDVAHSLSCEGEAKLVVPKAGIVLERVLRAYHEPQLIDHACTHELPRHGGMTRVYGVEATTINSRDSLGFYVIMHLACLLLFTKLGIIIEK